MPRAPASAKPRKRTPPAEKAATRTGGPTAPGKVVVAVPAAKLADGPERPIEEPVWLVRSVLVLFLVGFAAFLAREVYTFVQSLG